MAATIAKCGVALNCLCLLVVTLFKANATDAADDSVSWSYKDQHLWPKHSKYCGQREQSPVEIYDELCEVDNDFRLVLHNYSLPYWSGTYYWENDGHTFKMTREPNTDVEQIATGSIFDDHPFAFTQLHLHWGSSERGGSEHQINGQKFDLELHYVNKKVDPDEQRNQLAVLAVLFKVGKHNAFFDPLIMSLKKLRSKGSRATLKPTRNESIADALPVNINSFYSYDGSLTTPGCNQNVQWVVFKQVQQISQEQLLKIRQNHKEKENVRISQKLNGRVVVSVDGNSASVCSSHMPMVFWLSVISLIWVNHPKWL